MSLSSIPGLLLHMSVLFMAINMTLLDREMYPPPVSPLFPPTPTITCNFMSRSKITCEFQEVKPLIQMVHKTLETAGSLLSPLPSSRLLGVFVRARKGVCMYVCMCGWLGVCVRGCEDTQTCFEQHHLVRVYMYAYVCVRA